MHYFLHFWTSRLAEWRRAMRKWNHQITQDQEHLDDAYLGQIGNVMSRPSICDLATEGHSFIARVRCPGPVCFVRRTDAWIHFICSWISIGKSLHQTLIWISTCKTAIPPVFRVDRRGVLGVILSPVFNAPRFRLSDLHIFIIFIKKQSWMHWSPPPQSMHHLVHIKLHSNRIRMYGLLLSLVRLR